MVDQVVSIDIKSHKINIYWLFMCDSLDSFHFWFIIGPDRHFFYKNIGFFL